jgi:CelD/BcsL family acetyltransferase involved in cellulose biosynthesis
MLVIEKISTEVRLNEIREAWTNLLKSSPADDLFLHPVWISAWMKVFGKSYDLYFIALWNHSELVGLFPLCRATIGPFRFVMFVGSPVSDRMDFVVKQGKEKECVGLFLQWLLEQRDWDKVLLDNFGALSKFHEILIQELDKKSIDYQLSSSGRYYYIPVRKYGSFKEYLEQSKTRKSLKHLRNYRNRLLNGTDCRWDILGHLDGRTIEQMISLDTVKSIRGIKGDSFFSDREKLEFFKVALPVIQEKDWLRSFVYMRGKSLHAYEINFQYNNRVLSYQAAFDKELLQNSPGTVTCFEAIRDTFEHGFDEYDFLLGDEAYKNHWSNDFRKSIRVEFYQNGFRARTCFFYFKSIKPVAKKFFRKAPRGEKSLLKLPFLRRLGKVEAKGRDSLSPTLLQNIEVIKTYDGLKTLRPAWERLLKDSELDDPFLHPAWVESWKMSFQGAGRLFFIVSHGKKEVSGIFPFCMKRKGAFNILSFAGTPVSDRMDFILEPADKEKTIDLFFTWIKSQSMWDMMALENLCARTDSPDLIKKICQQSGLKFVERYEDDCYFVNLESYEDFNEYFKSTFNRKHRNYFRRLNKKTMKIPGARWELEQVLNESLMREMMILDSQRSIRGEALQCFFSDPAKQHFLKRLWSSPYFQEITRVFTFRSDEGLHAYLLFFACNNKLLAYQTAFDKKLRGLSVGTQLFLESIRYAFENSFIEYDFLKGDEDFKKRFTSDFRQTRTLLIFPDTWKGRMCYRFYESLRPMAKKMYNVLKIGQRGHLD